MCPNRIYEPIKLGREKYFVEYHPPKDNNKIATLSITFLQVPEKVKIIQIMDMELDYWIKRFPIPLMISSFDAMDKLINLKDEKPSDHLVGFLAEDGLISRNWKLLKDNEIPDIASNHEYIDNLFSKIKYITYEQYDTERQLKRHKLIIGRWIIFGWVILIPVVIGIFEYFIDIFSLLALIIIVIKAIMEIVKYFGLWPKSKKEKVKEEENHLKDHYYYHCQLNPDGFKRLMNENLDKETMNRNIKEAAELMKKSKSNNI
jgi:hypothetical protein